jgi:RimJ/RimL family protein N-acetyltransferase
MELLRYTDADLGLSQALETDPEVMKELGGPRPKAEIAKAHRKRLNPWWLKIVPESGGPAVGTIGIWESSWEGSAIHETGWMVLPAHQGRGIASGALGLLLERARAEASFERIHAFPGVTNGPSNALCRKHGFVHTGRSEVEFSGRPLRVHHWELALRGVNTVVPRS